MQETHHREVRNLIGGSWEEANGRQTEPVYDPATGEVVAETPLSTAEDLDRAVGQAAGAFPGWAATPVVERARILQHGARQRKGFDLGMRDLQAHALLSHRFAGET
jgi:acyl-CoA reductase-like NAD-dependent aldehyde dehydrogenase